MCRPCLFRPRKAARICTRSVRAPPRLQRLSVPHGIVHPLRGRVSASPYLTVEQVAERLHTSVRTIRERTRTAAIPHRRLPGQRRCLFLPHELDVWLDGAQLELVELDGGGRVVRPRTNGRV
jgi:excisionase family DNA binding protein